MRVEDLHTYEVVLAEEDEESILAAEVKLNRATLITRVVADEAGYRLEVPQKDADVARAILDGVEEVITPHRPLFHHRPAPHQRELPAVKGRYKWILILAVLLLVILLVLRLAPLATAS